MSQQQVRERPAQEERPRSPWQRYRSSRVAVLGTILIIILLMGSYLVVLFSPQSIQAPAAQNSFTPDEIVHQVLSDENTNGWDEQNQGILINWRRDDVSKVNCSDVICNQRGFSTRHDTLNDLRDLENLYWYSDRHPDDSATRQYIARILPTVKNKWGRSTLADGWLYFTFLRLITYSHEPAYWTATLQHWVQAQYLAIDPRVGVYHSPTDTTAGADRMRLDDGYRVDHDLEVGLVLVDAGTRYQHPEWAVAGRREVTVVTQQTYSSTYHLFNRIYLLHDHRYGSNKVYDYQARMGENGQELEALLRVGIYTHTSAYLQLAKEMLDSLATLPLRDRVHGGFYFKIFLGPFMGHDAGYVDTSIKEARQLHMLPALVLANHVFNNRWSDLQAELVAMATTPHRLFLPAAVPGFTYQVKPDGALFPCSTCSPSPYENWISAEADNIALEGLQAVLGDKTMPF